MYKTLRSSFSLKNAYRVNGILYSLKQIPLLRKLLPSSLYQSRDLKTFANVLAVLWEIGSVFLGKLLYFLLLVCGIGAVYDLLPPAEVFLHILLLLTVIGCFTNTSLFTPSKSSYYAMVLLRMDARAYSISNYLYYSLKTMVGFLPFTLLFGRSNEIPLWLCLLLPLCIAGMKAFFVAVTLWRYEKRGKLLNDNHLSGTQWVLMAVFLAAAYGLPAFGFTLPRPVSASLFLLGLPLGILGFYKLLCFDNYRALNRELLADIANGGAVPARTAKQASERSISEDSAITSSRKGFEYLNELFIKRHKKTLWKVTKGISYALLLLFAILQVVMAVKPEVKTALNEGVLKSLPYFLFIMYVINRGTSFTQSLFMNCDHSLLTYAFFKKPGFILKLFGIRLREIMKINAVPALVIGLGLALTLYTSGGTDNPLNYAVLIVSVLCMSLFFSLHYLTMYYLLQPYNAGTEMKSGTYRVVSMLTYFACYFLMLKPMPSLLFGLLTIGFVVAYCIVASVLVYFLAPKTFKLRL